MFKRRGFGATPRCVEAWLRLFKFALRRYGGEEDVLIPDDGTRPAEPRDVSNPFDVFRFTPQFRQSRVVGYGGIHRGPAKLWPMFLCCDVASGDCQGERQGESSPGCADHDVSLFHAQAIRKGY